MSAGRHLIGVWPGARSDVMPDAVESGAIAASGRGFYLCAAQHGVAQGLRGALDLGPVDLRRGRARHPGREAASVTRRSRRRSGRSGRIRRTGRPRRHALIVRADPAELECLGWQALAPSGTAAIEFDTDVLDEGATMLLPGGLTLTHRESVLLKMSGRPWSEYRLEELLASTLTDDVVVIYGVVAERSGSPPYSARINSRYARRPGGWKLALHQQTPHGAVLPAVPPDVGERRKR